MRVTADVLIVVNGLAISAEDYSTPGKIQSYVNMGKWSTIYSRLKCSMEYSVSNSYRCYTAVSLLRTVTIIEIGPAPSSTFAEDFTGVTISGYQTGSYYQW